MGNPDFSLPSFAKLPEKTKEVISKPKNAGAPKQYRDHDLAGALEDVLNGNFLEEPRMLLVTIVGKRGKELLFQLNDYVVTGKR
jgi:mRNA-degrading endonuclease YafQ of YafQ-DinJ toxin-antitoxin module